MKTLGLLVFFIFIGFISAAQDYTKADRVAMSIPSSQTNSTLDIASYIQQYCKTDDEKVRAAYTWVISNIKYDADSIYHFILQESWPQLVTIALRRKKGVCENFAAIFDDICKKMSIRSFAIEGFTKQNHYADNTAHMWCGVCVHNEWSLYDPTWDAVADRTSAYSNMLYYQVSPEIFIQTHMPFDPLFQMLDHPYTFKEFYNGGIHEKKNPAYFNYKDSINAFEKMDSFHKYAGIISRIERNGKPNTMINTRLSQLRLEIEIIYQDMDSVLYNTAVAEYNKAINKFNDFVIYRNNQFKPLKTDEEVASLFGDVKEHMTIALKNLKELKQSEAVLPLDTGDIEYALNTLADHVKEQEEFFKTSKQTSANK